MLNKFNNMSLLFYFWMATLPFLSISPWQAIIGTRIISGLIFALIGFLAIGSYFIFYKKESITKIKNALLNNKSFYLLLLCFVIWNFISLYFNWKHISAPPYMQDAAGLKGPYLYNLFFMAYLLFNILILYFIQMLANNYIAIRVLFYASAASSFFGVLTIWGYMLGFVKELVFPAYIIPRLYGTATEPQSFGNYLIPILFLALIVLTEKKIKIVDYICAFFIFLAFLMTFSLGAFVGGAVGLVIFLILNKRLLSKEFYQRAGIISVLLIVFVIGINSLLWPGYYKAFFKYSTKIQLWRTKMELQSITKRIATIEGEVLYKYSNAEAVDDKVTRAWMAQAAMNMFKSNPVIGIGPGNYGFLYNDYRPKNSPIKDFIERTHNIYLQVLAENGLPGLIMFLGFLYVLIYSSAKKWFLAKDTGSKLVLAGLLSGFIGLLVHGLSYGILQHSHTWVIMGLLMAAKDNI